jgi:serine protease
MRRQSRFGVWLRLLSLATLGLLSSCGGGGGGDSPPPTNPAPNVAPVANAGAAQNVATRAVVTLNGSTSSDANGDPLTYNWVLTSKPTGSVAVLSGASTASPVFTADVAGTFVVTLLVSDGKATSAPATVTITAVAAAVNVAPVANAGPNQTAVTAALVRLDGRASADANGDPLTFTWALVKPPGSTATLADAKTSTPSFTPDLVGIYAAGLVVSDGKLNSAAVSVLITVTAPTVGPFTVSGTVAAASVSTVDSDTNDPNQQGRASNNTLATAQPSGNPGLVVGYVNQPGKGPQGVNFTAGDTADIYRADLVAGQVVELNFGDDELADLDLKVYDSAGNLVGSSVGVSRSECVLVRKSGTYSIQVFAYDGASTYELSWAAPRPSSTCPNVTPAASSTSAQAFGFVPGEIVGKALSAGSAAPSPQTVARAQGLLQSAGIEARLAAAADGPALLRLPATRSARAQALRTLQAGDRVRRLAAGDTSAAPLPVREAPADASEATRLAFDTVVAAKLLRQSGQFAYAELNWVLETTQTRTGTWPPNDTDVSRQPHLELIKLPAAFAALNSLSPPSTYTPIVAVVDTGIVANHPELQRMLVPGYDFVSNQSSAGDGDGIDADANDATPAGQNASFHGTHVAGTVAAETFNGVGMVGVAPMARIMPIRVLGVTGSGSMYDIMQGIRFAAGLSNDSGTTPARRADVINLSLGGGGACTAAIADVMSNVRAQGVIVVAAAGNESGAPVGMPANCANVIAVSAIAYDGSLATYSNVGPQVAVTAPGGDSAKSSPAGRDVIWSLSATWVSDAAGAQVRRPGYRALQGTSMATPHVAGVLALMRAVNPSITPAAVDTLLAAGSLTDAVGAAGRNSQFGYGRINALKAVQAAGVPTAATPSLQVSPSTLDFGSTLTELGITFRRVNGSTDTPTTYRRGSLNPLAVRVFLPTTPNPAAGPFNYTVRVDRTLLAPSETVVRVEFNTQAGAVVPFDVVVAPRPVIAVSQRGVGPLYVLAINADDTSTAVAGATAQSTTASYAYSITGVKVPRVVIAAGTDLDNDGFICGPAEPCSAYPTLGSPTVLELTANRNRVDFNLSSGSTNGAALSAHPNAPRGVARPR